jgi:hypothetical protein
MAEENTVGNKRPPKQSKFDQTFFLALATKDAWNKWRSDPASRGISVTFAGVDFSVAPRKKINFEGFEFGDSADFSHCKWLGGKRILHLSGLPKEIDAKDFIGSNEFVPGSACFTRAIFGFQATFAYSFGEGASFSHAEFGDLANFGGATFGWLANFNNAAFGDMVSFYGAAFDGIAVFENTVFRGRSVFGGRTGEEWTKTFEVHAKELAPDTQKALGDRLKEAWSHSGSGHDRFSSISFANARFYREATFSYRTFEEAADFTGARFYSPPDFHASINVAQIDFTGAYSGFGHPGRLHWTEDSRIPVRMRALRKIAEETKNHDLDDLYIEERKAERGVHRRQLLEQLEKATKWQKVAH